jgi:hypothetical protein
MNLEQIKALQKAVGAEPDGHFGPKSIAAVQAHLRARIAVSTNKWPATDQGSLTAFYGAAGDESKLVRIDAPDGILYEGQAVKKVLCHSKVAESLKRILTKLVVQFPEIARQYAGCYNNRAMRGGSTPSLHARGAAIDFDPDNNGNHTSWPVAATMPLGVMEIFADEGWISAGAFWGRDGMHMQATR